MSRRKAGTNARNAPTEMMGRMQRSEMGKRRKCMVEEEENVSSRSTTTKIESVEKKVKQENEGSAVNTLKL
jgi:hypothetical protein